MPVNVSLCLGLIEEGTLQVAIAKSCLALSADFLRLLSFLDNFDALTILIRHFFQSL